MHLLIYLCVYVYVYMYMGSKLPLLFCIWIKSKNSQNKYRGSFNFIPQYFGFFLKGGILLTQ